MKAFVKGVLLAGAVFATVAVLIVGAAYVVSELRLRERTTSSVIPIEIPTDASAISEGERIARIKGCFDCHGEDLGGKVFIDEPPIGRFVGANLTKGAGSNTSNYTDSDWIRAIRHGLDPSGRSLVFMPAAEFNSLHTEDLARLIAYLKQVPPVTKALPTATIGPLARVMYLFDRMPLLFQTDLIDLAQPIPAVTQARPDETYGAYLASGCTGCHGKDYQGGPIPGAPPAWPSAANLAAGSRVSTWTFEQFKTVLTEGTTPDGHQINPAYMPWQATKAMTDVELEALHSFIKSLSAK